MFEVGQRVRTVRINGDDMRPAWRVGDTGTIVSLGKPEYNEEWANVTFDPPADMGNYDNTDIVNFDEMEAI